MHRRKHPAVSKSALRSDLDQAGTSGKETRKKVCTDAKSGESQLVKEKQMEQQINVQTTRKRIDIEALTAGILAASPPVQELTRRAAIDALRPVLLRAIEAGHTPASLSAQLLKDGFRIGERTLTLWLNLTSSKLRPKTPHKHNRATQTT